MMIKKAKLQNTLNNKKTKSVSKTTVQNKAQDLKNLQNQGQPRIFPSQFPIQLKVDHLFNDLPKVIRAEGGGPESIKQENKLKAIRDSYKLNDIHGEGQLDPNHSLYCNHLTDFRNTLNGYRLRNGTPNFYIYETGTALWNSSIDDDVKRYYEQNYPNVRIDTVISNWNKEKKPSIDAILADIDTLPRLYR